MIIDNILDAKDGIYNAKEFYEYAQQSESMFFPEYPISKAMDGGTNRDVQREICKYIDENGYNPEIKTFVNSFTWVK